MLFAGRTIGHAKGRRGLLKIDAVYSGGNDRTEEFDGVERSGLSERE